MEFYLSDLLGDAVINQSKEKIGTVLDFVITDISATLPRVRGLVIKRGINKEAVFIPYSDLSVISPKLVKLTTDLVDLTPFIQRNDEVLLAKDVYDKQIVDIDDRRLTRANDLLLEEAHHVLVLKGVDVSVVGILKRLKIPTPANLLKHNIIDWKDVQFLGGPSPMKFKIHYKKLEALHPVDIARIIFEGPGYKQGSRVLASLQDPIAADIIEELSPKLQQNLIEAMKLDDVANVINQMPAHKAADLFVTLGSDYFKKILPLMSLAKVEQIKSLLNYPEFSTGAYMTTDYVAIPSGMTLDQVFTHLSKIEQLPDFMLYMYVLESEFANKLVGVLSVYELFAQDRRSRVETAMVKNLIVSHPQDHIKDSLKKMHRYNLSALPVISRNNGNRLIGVVTFRDAVSYYLPKRWKVRIRHVLPILE